MSNFMTSVQMKKVPKNLFNLSHARKLSIRMGELVPCLALECVPGDYFTIAGDAIVRFAPLIAPVYHRFNVSLHYFFVPNRIVWPGFEQTITNDDPVAFPYITLSNADSSAWLRFANHLGLPKFFTANAVTVSAIPFAGYQMVYDRWYRDQNLIAEVPFELVNGNNNANRAALCQLRLRAWEHDYFTSCLPFAQKGSPVDIPLGQIDENSLVVGNNTTATELESVPAGDPVALDQAFPADPNFDDNRLIALTAGLDVAPTTINDLRLAFRIQEWLEKNARGGTRYIEHTRAHFGVKSSDARLQNPEWITGFKTPVVISEVLNTTGEDGGLPQGNMAGHGVSVGGNKPKSFFCEEHGYIYCVMSVMPKTAYQQGVPRHFLRFSNLDYYWPSFAHLGEQEVKNVEIYAGQGAADDEVFGYQTRYGELRTIPDHVSGDFVDTLDYWHAGRIFGSTPALNQDFIECNPDDVARIFAVTASDDNLYVNIVHNIKAVRPLPKYGTPAI